MKTLRFEPVVIPGIDVKDLDIPLLAYIEGKHEPGEEIGRCVSKDGKLHIIVDEEHVDELIDSMQWSGGTTFGFCSKRTKDRSEFRPYELSVNLVKENI